MNKIVVTGAAGFIASSFIKECLNRDLTVFALDIVEEPITLPLNNHNLLYKKIDVYNFDDVQKFLNDKGIDTFFHFAWIGSSGLLRNDYKCQINNALSVVELIKVAKKVGCKKFITAGTIMEYEAFDAIYAQESSPHLAYIYGIGKLLAHMLAKPVANDVGIDLVWTLITNTYGVGELSPRLVNSTIRKCINHEELNFTAATQNYDFIYIDDVARAFYLLGEKGIKNKQYVIGSGQAKPLKEFLISLVKICDANAILHFGSIPFTGVNQSLATFSIEEIKKDCGFVPSVSFEEGIKRTFEWLKEIENAKI